MNPRAVRILVSFMLYITILSPSTIDAHITIEFNTTRETYAVLNGDRVSLVCSPTNVDDVSIYNPTTQLVNSGSLDDSLSDQYAFECNETTCTLNIKEIERTQNGAYSCFVPAMFLIIEVFYIPSNLYPICTSSYISNTFFFDSIQEPFIFTCVSEEGNPSVNMTLSIHRGDEENKYLTMDQYFTTNRSNQYVSLSYSPYLDLSFHNATMVCNITQQLPAPYPTYHKSCFVGPLLSSLSSFSVSIYPSNYKVYKNKRENITLTCTSNVSGVLLEWNNIPLKDGRYMTRINNDSLQLELFDYGSSIDKSIIVYCSGSYGERNISQNARIELLNGEHNDNKENSTNMVVLLAIVFSLVIMIFIICPTCALLIYLYDKSGKREKYHEMTEPFSTDVKPTVSHNSNVTNTANADTVSCTTGGDDVLNCETASISPHAEESVDNPIYGSKSNQTGRITSTCDSDVSNAGIEMTENVTYESHEQMDGHGEGGTICHN